MTREEAIDVITKQIEILTDEIETLKPKEYIEAFKFDIAVKEKAIEALKEQPIVRAKWEDVPLNVSCDKYGMNKYNMRTKCTNCGFVTDKYSKSNYCINCGAKMEELKK